MNSHSCADHLSSDKTCLQSKRQEQEPQKSPPGPLDMSEPVSLVTDELNFDSPQPKSHFKPIHSTKQSQESGANFINAPSSSLYISKTSLEDIDKYLHPVAVNNAHANEPQTRSTTQTEISVDIESFQPLSDYSGTTLPNISGTTLPNTSGTTLPNTSGTIFPNTSGTILPSTSDTEANFTWSLTNPSLIINPSAISMPHLSEQNDQSQKQHQLQPQLQPQQSSEALVASTATPSLLCIAAHALAQALYPSLDGGINDEVYGKFISLAVDCAPLVRADHQTVMTSLLRRTSRILNVTTILPWHHPNLPPAPNTVLESLAPNDKLTASVILVGLFPMSSAPHTQYYYRRKRRAVRRALVLAAAPCSQQASDSIDQSIVDIQVMMSFTMTVTTALAAFARLRCDVTLTQHVKGASNAEFSVRLTNHRSKLSFAVSFIGDAPCSIRFHTPGILALRHIDKFTKVARGVKAIIEKVEKEVLMWDCSRKSISLPSGAAQ